MSYKVKDGNSTIDCQSVYELYRPMTFRLNVKYIYIVYYRYLYAISMRKYMYLYRQK